MISSHSQRMGAVRTRKSSASDLLGLSGSIFQLRLPAGFRNEGHRLGEPRRSCTTATNAVNSGSRLIPYSLVSVLGARPASSTDHDLILLAALFHGPPRPSI